MPNFSLLNFLKPNIRKPKPNTSSMKRDSVARKRLATTMLECDTALLLLGLLLLAFVVPAEKGLNLAGVS